MSIKTTKTEAHRQRAMPKPLRKGGLHNIEYTGAVYAQAKPLTAPSMADLPVAMAKRLAQQARERVFAAAPVRNSTMRGAAYTCPELSTPSTRPGAMDAFRLPSRTSFAADTPSKD